MIPKFVMIAALIFSTGSNLAFAQSDDGSAASAEELLTYIKKLHDQGELKVAANVNLESCRPAGFACKSSGDCCSFCNNGICNGKEVGRCRPAGFACSSSGDCCSFCNAGVCNGKEVGRCRPEGLKCKSSGDCCHFCNSGICS